jgi:hypothetical protein
MELRNVFLGDLHLGRELSRDEFMRLDPGNVYHDLVAAGACGAPGVVFMRPDGSVGVEDGNAEVTDEATE